MVQRLRNVNIRNIRVQHICLKKTCEQSAFYFSIFSKVYDIQKKEILISIYVWNIFKICQTIIETKITTPLELHYVLFIGDQHRWNNLYQTRIFTFIKNRIDFLYKSYKQLKQSNFKCAKILIHRIISFQHEQCALDLNLF